MDWQAQLQQLLNDPDLPSGLSDQPDSAQPVKPTKRERLDIILERKGRAGKVATIIAGFSDSTSDDDIASLAARLKQRLGTGGSARGGEILIQGDRRDDVARLLKAEGYTTRII